MKQELTMDIQAEAIRNMTKNLSVLRTMLNLTQAELASIIGIGRQTLVAVENNKRAMSWSVFLSLLFVFSQNKETQVLLEVFNIYTSELKKIYSETAL